MSSVFELGVPGPCGNENDTCPIPPHEPAMSSVWINQLNSLTLPLAVPRGTALCGPRHTIMCPEARDHAPKGNIPSESSRFPNWVEWLSQLSRVVIPFKSSVFLSVISFLWPCPRLSRLGIAQMHLVLLSLLHPFCGTNKLCVLLRSLRDLSNSMPSTPSACSVLIIWFCLDSPTSYTQLMVSYIDWNFFFPIPLYY